MFANILEALTSALSPQTLLLLAFGTAAGIAIGAMPGLSVNMGIALLYPMTFTFKGVQGIIMLLGVYCGAIYGGSISAILLKTPGTPASAATVEDGYPMANEYRPVNLDDYNGPKLPPQPGRALGLSTFASMFGGIFSAVMLILLAPQLARVATSFSKPEYFALALFGISIISSVSSESVLKGVIGGFIGLFIATIGIDSMSGKMRFTFGNTYLIGGVSFIPILIGLFAFAQVRQSIEDEFQQKHDAQKPPKTTARIDRVFPTAEDLRLVLPTILRSSVIGTFIGCVPGTGGDISSWIAYNEAKRWAKDKRRFGHGDPRGICASESGNNSVSGGAMIPMLTLGIPGDGATAILMGALMVQGLQPGPLLFSKDTVRVYAIFIGFMLANILMGIFGFSLIRLFAKVIHIPHYILIPAIVLITFVGTYSYNHSMIDVYIMLGFGILGYFLKKFKFAPSAIILGIILGATAEQNFSGSLIMSRGDFSIFLTSPICAIFLVVSLISVMSPLIGPIVRKILVKETR